VHDRFHDYDRQHASPGSEQRHREHGLRRRETNPQLVAPVLPLAAEKNGLKRRQRHSERDAGDRYGKDRARGGSQIRWNMQQANESRDEPESLQRDRHHADEHDERRRDRAINLVTRSRAERRGDVLGERRHDAELQQPHVAGERSKEQPDPGGLLADVADHERKKDQVGEDVDDETGIVPRGIPREHAFHVSAGVDGWFGHARGCTASIRRKPLGL
jgi:hypothetical protein